MPRVKRQETGQNIDPVRRNEGNDNVSENPISEKGTGSDRTLILNVLYTSNSEENLNVSFGHLNLN